MRHPAIGRGLAVGLLVGAIAASACAVNPATGERQLSFISEAQEIQMGREADAQIVQQMGLVQDEAIQAYVSELGLRMARASERPDLPWTFRVIDDPVVNAFALPGGFIYVTRGIMAHLTSEAELVGVLGHEIGHVTAMHSVNQISRQQLLGGLLGAGMIFVPELRPFADAASLGIQLMSLRYGRDDERQADDLGFRYMTAASYDPGELVDVFGTLGRLSEGSSASGIPSWLSSHPDPGERQERVLATIAATTLPEGLRVEERSYLARLDGMVFGQNPREGFFRSAVFHHPDLRFRMTFPAGWNTLNSKQAVQAVSTSNDAALILELAPAESAEAARTAFLSQSVRAVATRSDPVDGLTARWVEFVADTQQGRLRGIALFVEYGGNVYSIMGFAPDQAWSRHSGTILTSLSSFGRESDPEILAVQPDRLDLVNLTQPVTPESFFERFPSAIEVEQVALINQVRLGELLPASRPAKRIIGG